MNRSLLKREFRIIQVLVYTQRSIRLIFRSFWLLGAGYLIGWGCNSIWGWFPDRNNWLLLGILFSIVPVFNIFFPLPRVERLLWQVDRRLGYKEQISTAYEVIQTGISSEITEQLIEEVLRFSTEIRYRILRKGWFLEREILSLVIIIFLYWLVFSGGLTVLPLSLPETQVKQIPPLGNDPSANIVFPAGIPGLLAKPTPASNLPGSTSDQPGEGGSQDGQGETQSELNAINAALGELGKDLSQQAVSYSTGQALEQGDLSAAAESFEDLADQVDQLSDQTKRQLGEAMKEAADKLGERSGKRGESLKKNLEAAASSLEAGTDLSTKNAFADISEDLRQISEEMAGLREASGELAKEEGTPNTEVGGVGGSSAVGSRQRSSSESLDRFEGATDILELLGESDQPGILRAGINIDKRGESVIGGEVISAISPDEAVITSVLTPYHYPWIRRNVVSTYFTTR
jgi:hypothetical protein